MKIICRNFGKKYRAYDAKTNKLIAAMFTVPHYLFPDAKMYRVSDRLGVWDTRLLREAKVRINGLASNGFYDNIAIEKVVRFG